MFQSALQALFSEGKTEKHSLLQEGRLYTELKSNKENKLRWYRVYKLTGLLRFPFELLCVYSRRAFQIIAIFNDYWLRQGIQIHPYKVRGLTPVYHQFP